MESIGNNSVGRWFGPEGVNSRVSNDMGGRRGQERMQGSGPRGLSGRVLE